MKQNIFLAMLALAAMFAMVPASYSQNNNSGHMLEPLLSSYFHIERSLAIDRPDSARLYAKEFLSNARAISTDSLPEQARSAWNKYAAGISKEATAISKSTSLVAERKAFSELSVYLYNMLKHSNIAAIDLFYQYCPMADSYWLSDVPEIANPYYGRQMSSCGSTSDTLKTTLH